MQEILRKMSTASMSEWADVLDDEDANDPSDVRRRRPRKSLTEDQAQRVMAQKLKVCV